MKRLVLVGCGKSKRPHADIACDLYTGNLFAARRRHAALSGARWWVVSAKYGLVSPTQLIEPYDVTIGDLSPVDRAAWFVSVAAALLDELNDADDPGDVLVEVHAAAAYARGLIAVLQAVNIKTAWPVEGLGIGDQLAWYGGQLSMFPEVET